MWRSRSAATAEEEVGERPKRISTALSGESDSCLCEQCERAALAVAIQSLQKPNIESALSYRDGVGKGPGLLAS